MYQLSYYTCMRTGLIFKGCAWNGSWEMARWLCREFNPPSPLEPSAVRFRIVSGEVPGSFRFQYGYRRFCDDIAQEDFVGVIADRQIPTHYTADQFAKSPYQWMGPETPETRFVSLYSLGSV